MPNQGVKSREVDDRGTKQDQAQELLAALLDEGFDGNEEKFAIALGRSKKHIEAMISGAETIDDDVVMKARGIALNRGVEIE